MKIGRRRSYSRPLTGGYGGAGGDAVILGPSRAVGDEQAGMQLFSPGGEEGLSTEPPAAPGREITASTVFGWSNMAGK